MARHRDPLPEKLKELVLLCRRGHLFEIEKCIHAGEPYQPAPGNYQTTPFRAAVASGFHSLVEVFLRAGVDQAEKDRGVVDALDSRRLDLIELLATYGANLKVVDATDVIWRRNPAILRWFIDQGLDLETGWPIASALRHKHREFLGIYMSLRDKLPSARRQADMIEAMAALFPQVPIEVEAHVCASWGEK